MSSMIEIRVVDRGSVGISIFFFFKQKTAYEMIW